MVRTYTFMAPIHLERTIHTQQLRDNLLSDGISYFRIYDFSQIEPIN